MRLLRFLDPRIRPRKKGLAQQIEAEIRLAIEPHAAEPNDEKLWALTRGRAENVLTLYWQDARLVGETTEEAFFVRCDRTTMTQSDIDSGRLILLVGFAPARPAEFELLRIDQQQV